jgi:hypothetical protein
MNSAVVAFVVVIAAMLIVSAAIVQPQYDYLPMEISFHCCVKVKLDQVVKHNY